MDLFTSLWLLETSIDGRKAAGFSAAVCGSQSGILTGERTTMKLRSLILATAFALMFSAASAELDGEDILRRQLRVGKMVASLFENQHQTQRELEEQMEEEDDKPKEVQAEPSRFRMRRLRSPNYVELIE